MEKLKSEYISSNPNAKILVVFGGDVHRRDEMIELLRPIENLTIYGTLSEEEGLQKIEKFGKVDIVLIGGRYTNAQRQNIKNILKNSYPNIHTTEPGIDYLYSNENIYAHIKKLTNNQSNK